MKKPRIITRWAAILIAVSCLASGARIYAVDSGYCFSARRVLTLKEIKHNMIDSMLDVYVRNAKIRSMESYPGSLRVGVVYKGASMDFVKKIIDSKNNANEFESNFGINVVYDGVNGHGVIEPNIDNVDYVVYVDDAFDTEFNKPVAFVKSDSVANDDGLIDDLINNLHGYGKYYYKIYRVNIETPCCDSRRKFQSLHDYMKDKIGAYNRTERSFKNNWGDWYYTVPLDSCGRVISSPYDDGFGYYIHISSGQRAKETQLWAR